MTETTLLQRYRAAIEDGATSARDPGLLMARDGDVEVFYAPFEYVNPRARIVLVGITPGSTQMTNALAEARRLIKRNVPEEEILRSSKQFGAFSGEPMRGNLIRQLDHWGINRLLTLESCAELFGAARGMVHSTSLLRFPVFVRGANYNGSPNMLRHPVLRAQLLEHFAREIASLGGAVVIGLGPKVSPILDWLANRGLVDRKRLLTGILHPSPNNTYRIDYLTSSRSEPPPWKSDPQLYDRGRAAFQAEHLSP